MVRHGLQILGAFVVGRQGFCNLVELGVRLPGLWVAALGEAETRGPESSRCPLFVGYGVMRAVSP
jgi:hypothetical protein